MKQVTKNPKRIVLGMSGGVDSSVCAYLLKKQGYEVIGLFMQNWDTYLNHDVKGHLNDTDRQCNVQKDFADAQAVAKKLDIQIHRVEFIEKYWKHVFQYLLREYRAGRTPNPDVLCNKHIKFAEFINYAKKHFNCDQIAMGHYANVKTINRKTYLCEAKCQDKDQTYFLCWLSEKQLQHVSFPIGNLTKDQVRKIAQAQGFINWDKKDSTGICFIGERRFKEFLNNYFPYREGQVIDIVTNKVIGTHQGALFFTYGQNKGLSLSGQTQKYFVCNKDIKKNIVYVCDAKARRQYLTSTKAHVTKFNWINGIPKNKHIQIRFRHRQTLIPGTFSTNQNCVLINYKPTLSVTPGQFAVFYQKHICLGGGIVQKVSLK